MHLTMRLFREVIPLIPLFIYLHLALPLCLILRLQRKKKQELFTPALYLTFTILHLSASNKWKQSRQSYVLNLLLSPPSRGPNTEKRWMFLGDIKWQGKLSQRRGDRQLPVKQATSQKAPREYVALLRGIVFMSCWNQKDQRQKHEFGCKQLAHLY